MQGRNSGYFLVHRSLYKNPVFKSLVEASIWIYMVGSATHKDKNIRYIDNHIAILRGEIIFPVRKNAKIWNIPYTALRSFLLRLKRRKMISIRIAKVNARTNAGTPHLYLSVSIIRLINYEKYQFINSENENERTLNAPQTHNYNTITNTNTNIYAEKKNDKSSKDMVYTKNYFGEYQEVVFKGKRYHKHRWKDEVPLKEIK
jgi:hypothetical protein